MAAATPPVEDAPRGHLLAACLLVGLLALIATSKFLFDPTGNNFLARYHADSQAILGAAREATPGDWLRWWTGSWIEPGMFYYRPLTSTLMGIEWELFGENVIGFCATGWLIHTVNVILLFLLAFGVFRGSAGTRMLMAFTAAALFTLPTRGNQGVAAADVQWWPAQTDMLSLTFALASLLTLDRALRRPGPVHLWPALLLAAGALGSKEMAITLPVPALLLALNRRRDWRPVLLGYLALSAAVLWMRFFAVPNAMGPGWKPWHFLGKALMYVAGEPGALAAAGVLWMPVATAAALVSVWALRRLRVEWPWVVPVPLVVIGLAAEPFGQSWAVLFTGQVPLGVLRCAGFYLGLWLIWRARRWQPSMLVTGSVLVIHLPIIHVGGVHYYYWPAAFWGLFYAVVLAQAARMARDAVRDALPTWQPGTAAGRCLRSWLLALPAIGAAQPAGEPLSPAS